MPDLDVSASTTSLMCNSWNRSVEIPKENCNFSSMAKLHLVLLVIGGFQCTKVSNAPGNTPLGPRGPYTGNPSDAQPICGECDARKVTFLETEVALSKGGPKGTHSGKLLAWTCWLTFMLKIPQQGPPPPSRSCHPCLDRLTCQVAIPPMFLRFFGKKLDFGCT